MADATQEEDSLHDDCCHGTTCTDGNVDSDEEGWDTDSSDSLGYLIGEEWGYPSWAYLPQTLLENIFLHLPLRYRYVCSQVCKSWYMTFHSQHIWRHLLVNEKAFTYMRFNLYRGYLREVSHHQVQLYLGKLGRHLRSITILPITNFYNLYEFVKVLEAFICFFDTYPMPCLKRFEFTFACERREAGESMIFGTGGEMLDELMQLLASFRGLEYLKLNDLLLSERDAPDLLSKFVQHGRESLRYLEVLNVCKVYFPHFYVGMFPNLRKLTISPSQLSDDVVIMLGNHSKLGEIVIVQDKYTCPCEPVSRRAWTELKTLLPYVQVRLELRGLTDTDILIQPSAPVHTIVYKSSHAQISASTILQVIDNYKKTLRVYGHCYLPRKFGSRSFHERADTYLVMLARSCPKLETLIIRERISTTTLLIIVSLAHNLRRLFVRQNALLKRFDWPRAPQWTERYYEWLRKTAKSEQLVEQEVSKLLGTQWKMLSDKWFKNVTV